MHFCQTTRPITKFRTLTNYYELIKAEALTDCMFGTELDVCDGLHHKPQSVQLIAKAMLHCWNMEEK